ncbi:hypothetical protein MRX96_006992 [Rhipicephalus microplus]
MGNLLLGLRHVVVYFHHVLVTGRNDKDHLGNVTRVLGHLTEAILKLKLNKYISPAELTVVRFLGILVLCAPLVMVSGANPFRMTGIQALLLFRGLLGASSLFLRFYAIHYMSIADASVIIFSVPVFVSALARIFLKEPCSILHLATVLVTVVGQVLITKFPILFIRPAEGGYPVNIHKLVAPFCSTVFRASVYIVLRRLREVHLSVIMFNCAWVAILETGTISLITTELLFPQTVFDGSLLFGLGALSFSGQLLLTRALQLEQAGPVSMVRSSANIILVFAWQVALFSQVPDCYTISGAVLFTACLFFTGLRRWIDTLTENSVTRAMMAWLLF